jgi:hypothetical protein
VLLRRHEEKETDVAIAAAIVETAARGDCSEVTLMSGDTDLPPALRISPKKLPEHVLANPVVTPDGRRIAKPAGW